MGQQKDDITTRKRNFGYIEYNSYMRRVKRGKKPIDIARDMGFEINNLLDCVRDYERGLNGAD